MQDFVKNDKNRKRLKNTNATKTAKLDNEKEWLRLASNNPVFGFLNNPEEDIYTMNDGNPFKK